MYSRYWVQFQVFVGMLSYSCNGIKSETRNTLVICHKLIRNLRSSSGNVRSKMLAEELHVLARKLHVTSPHISAAGFFDMDYTIILGLISCITTYLLVFIQMNTIFIKKLTEYFAYLARLAQNSTG